MLTHFFFENFKQFCQSFIKFIIVVLFNNSINTQTLDFIFFPMLLTLRIIVNFITNVYGCVGRFFIETSTFSPFNGRNNTRILTMQGSRTVFVAFLLDGILGDVFWRVRSDLSRIMSTGAIFFSAIVIQNICLGVASWRPLNRNKVTKKKTYRYE